MRVFALRVFQILGALGVVGFILMLRSAPGVRGVCDGLERCCDVSAVCGIGVELGVRER